MKPEGGAAILIDRQDILYCIRSTRRTPLLTAVVVLALAVGIGLNAGVFAILNALFLKPPTEKAPATFVQIYPSYEGWFAGTSRVSSFTTEDYEAIRTQTHTLSEVAAWQSITTTLDETHRSTNATLASCNYFQVFGVDRPMMGRFFLSEECKPGAEPATVVLSEHFWRDFYSADPQIVGKVIHIGRHPLTVVGVMRDGAAGVLQGNAWIPYTMQPAFNHGVSAFKDPTRLWLSVAGRLRPGFSRADARAELQTILSQQDRLYLAQKVVTLDRKTSLLLTDGAYIHNPLLQSVALTLMCVIMGPLLLVLLLACTNVTMLFLSRSIVRRGEIAIRLALGAGRNRLLRMLTLESFLTAAIAGLISVWLASRIPKLIFASMDPEAGSVASGIRSDWTVFGYLAALVMIATVVSALAPMRESFRFDLIDALKGREGASTMRSRTTTTLIVAQLAMSFVLLAAAVLFARLPGTITGIDAGFETRQTMEVPLDIEMPPYTETSTRALYRSLETRILTVPGVQSVAYESLQPFSPVPPSEIRFDKQTKGQGRPAAIDNVSQNFFSTFSIPLLHGRAFQPSDVSAATVAVVSLAFARTFWGNADPLGRIVVTPDDRRLVVIGVARDTRSEHFGIVDGPRIYTLRGPQALGGGLFVRFSGDAAPVSTAIEQIVRSLDASQTGRPATVWNFLETNAATMRSLARIIVFMAGIAVLLAVTGVYAALSFAINQRVREFGIQMMLGATRQVVFRAVMMRGLRQIAIGLLCGAALALPAAWAFMRITQRAVVHIDAFDVPIYLVSAAILLAVSLCAMFLPALRATQVDPMQVLRNE